MHVRVLVCTHARVGACMRACVLACVCASVHACMCMFTCECRLHVTINTLCQAIANHADRFQSGNSSMAACPRAYTRMCARTHTPIVCDPLMRKAKRSLASCSYLGSHRAGSRGAGSCPKADVGVRQYAYTALPHSVLRIKYDATCHTPCNTHLACGHTTRPPNISARERLTQPRLNSQSTASQQQDQQPVNSQSKASQWPANSQSTASQSFS